jgi:hypothetical protein
MNVTGSALESNTASSFGMDVFPALRSRFAMEFFRPAGPYGLTGPDPWDAGTMVSGRVAGPGLAPFPIADFREVFAVLGDVLLVLDELVLKLLF